jgi:hypothetical protein
MPFGPQDDRRWSRRRFPCGKQNCFPWLSPGVLVILATCEGQFVRFKWAASELLRFADFLVRPDYGVATVLLVTFDAVGTVSFNSHGFENQLHPPSLRFRLRCRSLFSQEKIGYRLPEVSDAERMFEQIQDPYRLVAMR